MAPAKHIQDKVSSLKEQVTHAYRTIIGFDEYYNFIFSALKAEEELEARKAFCSNLMYFRMACIHKHFELAEFMMDFCGLDVDHHEEGEPTTFWQCATSMPDGKVLQFLVERGASVNFQPDRKYSDRYMDPMASNGFTALHVSCYNSRTKDVALLIGLGANVNIPDHNGETCLMTAMRRAYMINPEAISTPLLQAGADINAQDNFGRTPLLHAIYSNQWRAAIMLIEQGANIFLKDKNGRDALQAACVKNLHTVSKYIMAHCSHLYSSEALEAAYVAVSVANWDLPLGLLENNIEICAQRLQQEAQRKSVLLNEVFFWAISLMTVIPTENGSDKREKVMGAFEALVATFTKCGKRLKDQPSVSRKQEEMHTYLLMVFLSILPKDPDVELKRLLYKFIKSGQAESLKHGSLLHVAVGWPYLHWHPFHGILTPGANVIGLLLDCGADVNAQDCEQRTPLHIASSHDYDQAIDILLERGAHDQFALCMDPFSLTCQASRVIMRNGIQYKGRVPATLESSI